MVGDQSTTHSTDPFSVTQTSDLIILKIKESFFIKVKNSSNITRVDEILLIFA